MSMPTTTALPGLRPIPLLGSRADFLRFFVNPIRVMRQVQRDCGRIGALTAGSSKLVVAIGPDLNREVLADPRRFENFAEPPFAIAEDSSLMSLRRSLTALNGAQHRRLRRVVAPIFTKSAVASYRDDMVEVIARGLGQWQPGQTRDVHEGMIELTLGVMMRCIFGLDPTADEYQLGRAMLDYLKVMLSPSVLAFPWDLPGTPFRRLRCLSDEINDRIRALIARRREEEVHGNDVLSLLIRAADEDGWRIDDDSLIAQATMLFSAGHETTATTLSWTLFLLTQHPRIYQDLVDELHGVLQGEAPTMEQLGKLPLLDAVVNESMRIIPSLPAMFLRRGTEDFELGGYPMPAGSHIALSPFLTHRLPELYEEPERFLPRRWHSFKPSPYEYLPFGAGPRRCLGAEFAAQEIRISLAMLLQRFGLALADPEISYILHAVILSPVRMPMHILRAGQRVAQPTAIRGNVRELVSLPTEA